MITELLGHYGCYIGSDDMKLIVTHPDDMKLEDVIEKVIDQWMYPMARETTEGWDGMHGFIGEDDEDEEGYNERMEENAEYYCEVWDNEEHEGRCLFSTGLNTMDIKL